MTVGQLYPSKRQVTFFDSRLGQWSAAARTVEGGSNGSSGQWRAGNIWIWDAGKRGEKEKKENGRFPKSAYIRQ
jgi:hypothetical protein